MAVCERINWIENSLECVLHNAYLMKLRHGYAFDKYYKIKIM